MQIAVSQSQQANTRTAVAEAYAKVVDELGGAPDWVLVNSAIRHPAADIRATLASLGATKIHGCSSCLGVMTHAGVDVEGGFGLLGLRDVAGGFGVGVAALEGAPAAAAASALQSAIVAAGREGEVPALIWVSASPGTEEACIKGIEEVVGAGVPIVGGSAADDEVAGAWYVFTAETEADAAIVVTALYPSTQVHSAFHSGYAPTSTTGRVSAAVGRTIQTIDEEPAAAVFNRWTGGAITDALDEGGSVLAATTLYPLGRRVGEASGVSYYRLAHPESVGPDGSLNLFADVEVGEELVLMEGSTAALRTRAGRVAAEALTLARRPASEIAGALVIFCAGCMLTVREDLDDVVASLREVLGDAPFLGAFTFGEQGCFVGGENCHGNLMISVTVFDRA